jgi:hypothetical protein
MPIRLSFPFAGGVSCFGVWHETKVCETKVEFYGSKLPELGIEYGEGVS